MQLYTFHDFSASLNAKVTQNKTISILFQSQYWLENKSDGIFALNLSASVWRIHSKSFSTSLQAQKKWKLLVEDPKYWEK